MSSPKHNQKGSYAVVTGASTGIGYELARLMIRKGHGVVAVSRDSQRLQEAAEHFRQESAIPLLKCISMDLSKSDSAEELYKNISGMGLEVDILVNNAGVPVCGRFAETSLQDEVDMLELNITTLTRLTKLFLPDMLRQGRGRIMNVASVAGFFPGPRMAVYFATKAYVVSFTEALQRELRKTGVSVTALCPGATNTRFMERGGVENSGLAEHFMMSAEKVALAGYHGMMRGKRVVVPGIGNKLLVGVGKITPRGMNAAVVEKMVTGKRG